MGAATQTAYTEAGLMAMPRDIGLETLIRTPSVHYRRDVNHQENGVKKGFHTLCICQITPGLLS
jgi:hypothetical protein